MPLIFLGPMLPNPITNTAATYIKTTCKIYNDIDWLRQTYDAITNVMFEELNIKSKLERYWFPKLLVLIGLGLRLGRRYQLDYKIRYICTYCQFIHLYAKPIFFWIENGLKADSWVSR